MGALLKIPQLLTGAQGILIRIGLIALLCIGIWLWGATWGWQHEGSKLKVYQGQVSALGQAAAKIAADTKKIRDQTTKDVQQEYEDEIASIHAYYEQHPARVRVRVAAGCSSVCPAPHDPSGPDGTAPERGVGPTNPSPLSCALDAEKVIKLQEILRRNNFPVR